MPKSLTSSPTAFCSELLTVTRPLGGRTRRLQGRVAQGEKTLRNLGFFFWHDGHSAHNERYTRLFEGTFRGIVIRANCGPPVRPDSIGFLEHRQKATTQALADRGEQLIQINHAFVHIIRDLSMRTNIEIAHF